MSSPGAVFSVVLWLLPVLSLNVLLYSWSSCFFLLMYFFDYFSCEDLLIFLCSGLQRFPPFSSRGTIQGS